MYKFSLNTPHHMKRHSFFILLGLLPFMSIAQEVNYIPVLINVTDTGTYRALSGAPTAELLKHLVLDDQIYLRLDSMEYSQLETSSIPFRLMKRGSSVPGYQTYIPGKGINSNPSLSIDYTPVDPIAGQQVEIVVTGTNGGLGNSSADCYITLSLPQYNNVISYGADSDMDDVYKVTAGQSMSTCSGSQLNAQYVFIDGYEYGWTAYWTEYHHIWARVVPSSAGTLWAYYKMNIGNDREPNLPCNSIDQQGWAVLQEAIPVSTPPDVFITALWTEPGTPKVGDDVDIKVTFKNGGGIDADNINLSYYDDNSYIDDDSHGTLSPGASQTETEDNYNFTYSGTHYIKVIIDPVANETNTSNNSYQIQVTVLPDNYPPNQPSFYSYPSMNLFPTKEYSFTVDYTDPDGASDIEYVYFVLAQNDNSGNNPITLRVDPGALILSPSQQESTTNVTNLSVSRSSITNGYRITWTFRLKWNWIESTNVDAYAWTDDAAVCSLIRTLNMNKSYENDLVICSSSESADPVTANDSYTVTGTIKFEGCSYSPDDWSGISVEMHEGSTTGAILDSDGSVSSGYSVTWNTDDNDVGTWDIYILPKNSNHQPPNNSDTYWDKETVTIEPNLQATRFRGSHFIAKNAKYGIPVLLEAKLEEDNWPLYTDIPNQNVIFQIYRDGSWIDIPADGFLSTNSDGIAQTFYTVTQDMNTGAYPIRVIYPGNNTFAACTLQTSLNVIKPQWLLMVYMCADNDLQSAADEDLFDEMANGKDNDNVSIVVLIDRQTNQGIGGFAGTRKYKIVKTNQHYYKEYGELDLGAGNTLSEFVEDCVDSCLSEHAILVLWDHGSGIAKTGISEKVICQDVTNNNNSLTVGEVRSALSSFGGSIDILGFDACLMGSIEVLSEVKAISPYIIASEVSEGGDGWEYDHFLTNSFPQSNTSPVLFGQSIVAASNVAPNLNGQYSFALWNTGVGLTALEKAISGLAKYLLNTQNLNDIDAIIDFKIGQTTDLSFSEFTDLGEFLTDLDLNDNNIDDSCQKILSLLTSSNFRIDHVTNVLNNEGLYFYLPWNIISRPVLYDNYLNGVFQFTVNQQQFWDDEIEALFDTDDPTCNLTGTYAGWYSDELNVSCNSGDITSGIRYSEFQYSIDQSNWYSLPGPDSPDGKDWYSNDGYGLRFSPINTPQYGNINSQIVLIRGRSIDKAGNQSIWSVSQNFGFDLISPQFNGPSYSPISLAPGPTTFGQYISDALSGVLDNQSYPKFYFNYNNSVISENTYSNISIGSFISGNFEALLNIPESREGDNLYFRVLARDVAGNESWSQVHNAGVVLDDDTDPPSIQNMTDDGNKQPGPYSFAMTISDFSGLDLDPSTTRIYFKFNSSGIDENNFDGYTSINNAGGSSYQGTITIPQSRVNQDLYWRVHTCDNDNSPSCGWSNVKYAGKVLPLTLSISAGSDKNICPNGSVVLSTTVQGGIPPYQYVWTPTQSLNSANDASPTASPVYTTTYTVSVTDNNQVVATDQVTVFIDPLPSTPAIPTGITSICQGETGILYTTIKGPNTVSLDWSISPPTSGSIVGIGEQITINWSSGFVGQAEIKVRGINACGYGNYCPSLLVTVAPLPGKPLNVNGATQVCQGTSSSSYTCQSMANTTAYQWELSPANAGSIVGNTNNATVYWAPSFYGSAQVVVRGANNCGTGQQSDPVSVQVNATPVILMNDTLLVNYGNSISIPCTVSGGSGSYTYAWSPGAVFQNPTVSSPLTNILTSSVVATIMVTDVQTGCIKTKTVALVINGGPLGALCSLSQDTICAGDATTLNTIVSGGSGSYSMSVTSNPAGISINSPTVGASNSFPITPLTSLLLYVSVSDGLSTVNDTLSLAVRPLPMVYSISGSDTICQGDTGKYVVLGGSENLTVYQVYKNGQVYGTVSAGTGYPVNLGPIANSGLYTVEASNSKTSCSAWMSGTYDFIVNQLPPVDAGPVVSVPYGSTAQLTGSPSNNGNYLYHWTPAASVTDSAIQSPNTVNLINTTQFSLQVTDKLTGCINEDQTVVYVIGGPLQVNAVSLNSGVCEGNATQLIAYVSGGTEQYSFSWSSLPSGFSSTLQNPNVYPDISRLYIVEVFDGNDTVIDTVNITVYAKPSLYDLSGAGPYCDGDQPIIVLSGTQVGVTYTLYNGQVSSGFQYSGNGNQLSMPVGNGSWSILAVNQIGCSQWMNNTIEIIINQAPSTDAGLAQVVSYGNSTVLNGGPSSVFSGQYNYQWSPSNLLSSYTVEDPQTTNLLVPTWFHLTVTEVATGCSAEDSALITVVGGPLQVSAATQNPVICLGSSAQLISTVTNGTGNYLYSWSYLPAGFTSTMANPVVSPLQTTQYVLSVNDGNEIRKDTVQVTVCATPQNLVITDTGVHHIQLTWNIVPGAFQYVVNYRKTGTTSWQSKTSNVNSVIITGLDAATSYEIRARANCGGSETCLWSNTVNCSTQTCANTIIDLLVGQAYPNYDLQINSVQWSPQVPMPGEPVTMTISWTVNGTTASVINANAFGSWNTSTALGSVYTGVPVSGVTKVSFQAPPFESVFPVRILFALDDGGFSNYTSSNLPTAYHCTLNGHSKTYRTEVMLDVRYCQEPDTLLISSVSSVKAMVSWPAQALALGYQVAYRDTSSTQWITYDLTATTRELNGLIPNTTYEVHLRSKCAGNANSSWTPPVLFTTDDSCVAPNTVIAVVKSTANPGSCAVRVYWNRTETGARYKVQYRPTSGNWATLDIVMDTSFSITGLPLNSTYQFRVKTLCVNGDSSVWSNTASVTIQLPTYLLSDVWLSDAIDLNQDGFFESVKVHVNPDISSETRCVTVKLRSNLEGNTSFSQERGQVTSVMLSPGSQEDIVFNVIADNGAAQYYDLTVELISCTGGTSVIASWGDGDDPQLNHLPLRVYNGTSLLNAWISSATDLDGDLYYESIVISASMLSAYPTGKNIYATIEGSKTTTSNWVEVGRSDTLTIFPLTNDTLSIQLQAWLSGKYFARYWLKLYDETGYFLDALSYGQDPDLYNVKMEMPDKPLLSMIGTGNGAGKIRVNGVLNTLPYAAVIDSGTLVMLEALPDPGSLFSGWYNGLQGASNPNSFYINSNTQIQAEFALNLPDWTPPVPTVNVHRIFIPDTADISVNGAPIIPGDYLGVFYDSSGTEKCGGQVLWDGIGKTLLAYGKDVSADNGFEPGELFTWKIYRHTTASSEYLNPVYDLTSTVFTKDSTFFAGGISGIRALTNGQLAALTLTTSPSIVICPGSSVMLQAQCTGGVPPYSFVWSNGGMAPQISVNPLVNSSFVVTVTDQRALSICDTVWVTVGTNPTIMLSASDSTICQGGQVNLNAAGAATYAWSHQLGSGSSKIVSPLQSTYYTVTGTNGTGCSGTAGLMIAVNNMPNLTMVTPLSVCNGESIDLVPYAYPQGGTFSGPNVTGNTFTASGGAQMVTLYYSYTEPSSGCSSSDSLIVNVQSSPEAFTLLGGGDYCIGQQSVLLSLSGSQAGNLYELSRNGSFIQSKPGTGFPISFDPVQTGGSYSVFAMSPTTGCNSEMSNVAQITYHTSPLVTFNPGITQVFQGGGYVTLQGGSPGGGTYSGPGVSNGILNPGSLQPGIYTYSYDYTDIYGCSGSGSASIAVVTNNLNVSLSGDDYGCLGDDVEMIVWISGGTPPYEVIWTPTPFGLNVWSQIGSTTIYMFSVTADYDKTIEFIVRDANGFKDTAWHFIDVRDVNVNAAVSAPAVCLGDSIHLSATASEPVSFQWEMLGSTFYGSDVDMIPPYSYTATVYAIDYYGCLASDDIAVTVFSLPIANAGPDQIISPGDTAILSATGGAFYLWSTIPPMNSQTISVSPTLTSTYVVTVTDNNGCSATDDVEVIVSSGSNKVSGYLLYDNIGKTPMDNCYITLSSANKTSRSCITDITGYYEFLNVSNGQYVLEASSQKLWGGANSNDALIAMKHFAHMASLTGNRLLAADVNASGSVNTTDALLIAQRFVNLIPGFPAGDWCIPLSSMNFTGTGITDTLYTLCYGDLNNSFVPGSGKNSEPGVSIISDPTFNGSACGNSECYYPLRINEFFDLSALSLVIMWPEEVRVEDVLIPGSSMQPIFSQEGGLLRLSWYSLEPLMLAAGDTVLLFKINTGILKGMPVPVAISESEAINSGGQLERLQLAAPIIEDRKESYLEVFPVPSDGGVTLRYSCTTVESSTVIILNAQGQRIKEFVLEGKDAISGEIQVGSDELPSGAYVVTFLNNQVKLVKRIIIL
jgi:hypothetical protein